jgi:hypothetical protein
MPTIVTEYHLSRRFDLGLQSGRELIYQVHGTDDEVQVQEAVLAEAPPLYLGLQLDSISVEPMEGAQLWEARVRYQTVDVESHWTFSTVGGTQRVTQSLETISTHAPIGSFAPDFQGAIGVSQDRVEGVEIPVPRFDFTETHRFTHEQMTSEYKYLLFGMTGRMNHEPFREFAAGEVLFLGATGSRRGADLWEVTFNFAASPNVVDRTIYNIADIDKVGWDYLWVRYEDFADLDAYALVKRPTAVYVERVHALGNFAFLGIGTDPPEPPGP